MWRDRIQRVANSIWVLPHFSVHRQGDVLIPRDQSTGSFCFRRKRLSVLSKRVIFHHWCLLRNKESEFMRIREPPTLECWSSMFLKHMDAEEFSCIHKDEITFIQYLKYCLSCYAKYVQTEGRNFWIFLKFYIRWKVCLIDEFEENKGWSK